MSEPERCRMCGTQRRGAAGLGGSWERDRDGRTSWVCPGCARTNLRSIESKLPEEWW
jgi:hypothetical protein